MPTTGPERGSAAGAGAGDLSGGGVGQECPTYVGPARSAWRGFPCIALVCGLALASSARADMAELSAAYRAHAAPLRSPDDLAGLLRDAGGRRRVLLGEATHGTAEFYTWRAEISRRLIADHGFSFVAVEGDWVSMWRLNRYVTHQPGAGESAEAILRGFDRWPRWMWANREFAEFAEWLREHNADRPPEARAGLYGKDVYDAWGAMDLVLAFHREHHPDRAEGVARRYRTFAEHRNDPGGYARAMAVSVGDPGHDLREAFRETQARWEEAEGAARETAFAAKQAAFVVKAADRHYRAMVQPGAASWNHRADGMEATVERLGRRHGPEARGIVWAHNTHIGDARATDMMRAGMRNIGQLAREAHGPDQVFSVGFSTAQGRALAARQWEGRREAMLLPAPRADSLDAILLGMGLGDTVVRFPPARDRGEALVRTVGHRAVGVVFVPEHERQRNYVPTRPASRYNAILFIESTSALRPLHEREDGR